MLLRRKRHDVEYEYTGFTFLFLSIHRGVQGLFFIFFPLSLFFFSVEYLDSSIYII